METAIAKNEAADFYAGMNVAVERFLNGVDVAEPTRKSYRKGVTYFFDYLRETWEADSGSVVDFRDYIRSALIAWRDGMLAEGKAAGTVGTYLAAVKRYFSWMFSEGLMPFNPGAGIKVPKTGDRIEKEALTAPELRALLRAVETKRDERLNALGRGVSPEAVKLAALRDCALISVMAGTGLRAVEAERANYGDLRRSRGKNVLVYQPKGSLAKVKEKVLTELTYKPLMAYVAARRKRGDITPDAPLFVSFSNKNTGARLSRITISMYFKGYKDAAGIDNDAITLHSLRHTAITLALEAGAPLEAVQAMAGHKDVNTTLRYAHHLDRIDNAAEEFINF
jgi:integrase/recombinase XerC/integrase/recombinase XerD